MIDDSDSSFFTLLGLLFNGWVGLGLCIIAIILSIPHGMRHQTMPLSDAASAGC